MCMEDIQIGRQKKAQAGSTTVLVAPGGVPQQILSPDARRTHVRFMGAGAVFVIHGQGSNGTTEVVHQTGSIITAAEFDVEQFGQLVVGAWYATVVGANSPLVWQVAWLDKE